MYVAPTVPKRLISVLHLAHRRTKLYVPASEQQVLFRARLCVCQSLCLSRARRRSLYLFIRKMRGLLTHIPTCSNRVLESIENPFCMLSFLCGVWVARLGRGITAARRRSQHWPPLHIGHFDSEPENSSSRLSVICNL